MPSNYPHLRKLVKKFVGRDDTGLTTDEAKTAKELYPEAYAEYLRQRKIFNADWKAIVEAATASGLIPYQTLLTKLTAKGYPNVISKGFTGLIGPGGKLYTSEEDLIEGAPTSSFYPSVVMNPEYGKDEAWVFQGVKVDGSKGGYFYTAEYKHTQHVNKHAKVQKLDLLGIRKKWIPKVKAFNPEDARCVAATVLEVLWQFTARIGTLGNATFGICTLQVRHAFITAQGITLKYKGKDSVATTHKLLSSIPEHKPLIKNIKLLLEGKEPKDSLFTVLRTGGKQIRMYPAIVNKYWHSLGVPPTVTVHKIRTWLGTKVFYEEITKLLTSHRPKTLKEAKDGFKKAAEMVGKMLNHVRRTATGDKITGVTALNSYVDSSIQVLYWQELGYPLPAKLQKFATEN